MKNCKPQCFKFKKIVKNVRNKGREKDYYQFQTLYYVPIAPALITFTKIEMKGREIGLPQD